MVKVWRESVAWRFQGKVIGDYCFSTAIVREEDRGTKWRREIVLMPVAIVGSRVSLIRHRLVPIVRSRGD